MTWSSSGVRVPLLLAVGVLLAACRTVRQDPAPRPDAAPAQSVDCIVRGITPRAARGHADGGTARHAVDDGRTTVRTTDDDSTWYDVVLDVPNLCARRIALRVDTLTARLALDTRLGNLLQVRAGVDIRVGNLDLTIEGLEAEVLLLVHLDDVVYVVDRTLTTVDAHPDILGPLNGVPADGDAWPGTMLIGRASASDGGAILRTVDERGRILEYALSPAGSIIARRVAGQVMDLPVVSESTNASRQTVRQVRDVLGALIELTLESETGEMTAIRLLTPGA